jgi:hypothetical protein
MSENVEEGRVGGENGRQVRHELEEGRSIELEREIDEDLRSFVAIRLNIFVEEGRKDEATWRRLKNDAIGDGIGVWRVHNVALET